MRVKNRADRLVADAPDQAQQRRAFLGAVAGIDHHQALLAGKDMAVGQAQAMQGPHPRATAITSGAKRGRQRTCTGWARAPFSAAMGSGGSSTVGDACALAVRSMARVHDAAAMRCGGRPQTRRAARVKRRRSA
jgi:hypothetical protein